MIEVKGNSEKYERKSMESSEKTQTLSLDFEAVYWIRKKLHKQELIKLNSIGSLKYYVGQLYHTFIYFKLNIERKEF